MLALGVHTFDAMIVYSTQSVIYVICDQPSHICSISGPVNLYPCIMLI